MAGKTKITNSVLKLKNFKWFYETLHTQNSHTFIETIEHKVRENIAFKDKANLKFKIF